MSDNGFLGRSRIVLTQASKVCFCVAGAAFLAAGAGALVNHVFTGWMAVGGMTGVGLFYLALGVWNLELARARTVEILREHQAVASTKVDEACDSGKPHLEQAAAHGAHAAVAVPNDDNWQSGSTHSGESAALAALE